MTLTLIIPVPLEIQTRAFECAYQLLTDYLPRLDPTQRAIAADIARRKRETLTWEQAGEAFRLYGAVVERRV